MADTLVKHIGMAPSTAGVGERPAKQTNQPVQRRLVGQLSPRPTTRIHIAKPSFAAKPNLEAELAKVRKAWRTYRSTNSRQAVYIYLSQVYQVVTRWQRLDCAMKNARAAMGLRADAPQMKPEPFAIVIFCTSDPDTVDAKTRSKWARVCRYARKTKPRKGRLIDFIKAQGGLNECARLLARNRKIRL
jgi:hypothetical protein